MLVKRRPIEGGWEYQVSDQNEAIIYRMFIRKESGVFVLNCAYKGVLHKYPHDNHQRAEADLQRRENFMVQEVKKANRAAHLAQQQTMWLVTVPR